MKISVIITAYNHEKYITQAFESLFKQTLPPYEIVVVNDASTDSTESIIKEYGNKFKKFRYFTNKKNLGAYKTFNIAIKKARGDLIFFLDSDDIIKPYTLEVLHNEFEKDTDMVFGKTEIINKNGKVIGYIDPKIFSNGLKPDKYLTYLEYGNYIVENCILFRKSCLKYINLLDTSFKHHADYDFYLRMQCLFEAKYINKVICSYRQHGENITVKFKDKNEEEEQLFKLFKKQYFFLKKTNNLNKDLKRILFYKFRFLMNNLFKKKKNKLALHSFFYSLKIYPSKIFTSRLILDLLSDVINSLS